MMSVLKRMLVIGTAALLPPLSACGQLQMFGGEGQVLETTNRQPVEGATVTMECRRSGLIHGSTKIRDVEIISNKNGMYEFSFLDVVGCDFAYVGVSKAGYQESSSIHIGYGYTSFSQIPKFLHLTADADLVMLRLTAITSSRIGSFFHMDGSPAYAAEYADWYKSFLEAKDIAQTAREKQFVLEKYCEALPKLYSMMNDKEKADITKISFSHLRRDPLKQGKYISKQGKHDYDAEVLPYCSR